MIEKRDEEDTALTPVPSLTQSLFIGIDRPSAVAQCKEKHRVHGCSELWEMLRVAAAACTHYSTDSWEGSGLQAHLIWSLTLLREYLTSFYPLSMLNKTLLRHVVLEKQEPCLKHFLKYSQEREKEVTEFLG